jgi:hypothetical protein
MNIGFRDQIKQENGNPHSIIRRAFYACILPDQVDGSLGWILPEAMRGLEVLKNMLKMVAPVYLQCRTYLVLPVVVKQSMLILSVR